MTVKYLESLHYLNIEIRDIERRLADGSIPPEVLEIYRGRLEKSRKQRGEITDFIRGIENQTIRAAVVMRCKGLTWYEIAAALEASSGAAMQRRVSRYLKKQSEREAGKGEF